MTTLPLSTHAQLAAVFQDVYSKYWNIGPLKTGPRAQFENVRCKLDTLLQREYPNLDVETLNKLYYFVPAQPSADSLLDVHTCRRHLFDLAVLLTAALAEHPDLSHFYEYKALRKQLCISAHVHQRVVKLKASQLSSAPSLEKYREAYDATCGVWALLSGRAA